MPVRIGAAWIWHQRAHVLLLAGDHQGYRQVCADVLARFGPGTRPDWAVWSLATARTCLLVPNAVPDQRVLLVLAEKSLEQQPKYFGPDWDALSTLALAHYRAGQYDRGLRRIEQAMATNPEGDNGANRFLRAMLLSRQGRTVEARRWLDRGLQWRPSPGANPSFDYRLRLRLLRREAEALIQRSSGPAVGPRHPGGL